MSGINEAVTTYLRNSPLIEPFLADPMLTLIGTILIAYLIHQYDMNEDLPFVKFGLSAGVALFGVIVWYVAHGGFTEVVSKLALIVMLAVVVRGNSILEKAGIEK